MYKYYMNAEGGLWRYNPDNNEILTRGPDAISWSPSMMTVQNLESDPIIMSYDTFRNLLMTVQRLAYTLQSLKDAGNQSDHQLMKINEGLEMIQSIT